MDEAQLVDHGHHRPGDPADRADLAGDARAARTGNDRQRTEQGDARRLSPRRSSAAARGPTSSERPACRSVERWFESKGWRPRRHQLEMLELARAGRSALLVAATGAGKTLAGFLPTICELAEQPAEGSAHALRLAAEGARGRRPAQPHRPDRGNGAADPGRDPHRRHAVGPQGAAAGQAAAGAADHARIAEPAAELSRRGADVRESAHDRRRRAPRLRQGEARRPAVAVDVAAAEARAGPAPRRPVGDDQRPRRLPLVARAGCRHGAGRPRHRRSRRRARPVDPDPREQDPVGRPFRPSRRARGDAADRAAQDHARLLQHAQPRRADLPGPVGRERPGAADRHPPRQPRGRSAAQGRGGDGGGRACAGWSPPPASTSASTGATSTSSSRWARPRAARACCSGSAAPTTGSTSRAKGIIVPGNRFEYLEGARRARRDRRRRARSRDLPPRRARRARPAYPGDGGRGAVPAGRAAGGGPLGGALRRPQAGDVRGDPQLHRHRRLCAQGL